MRAADGHVQVDLGARLPGRGAYLCGQRQCWERALGRGEMLGRALRTTLAPDAREALLASAPLALAALTVPAEPIATHAAAVEAQPR